MLLQGSAGVYHSRLARELSHEVEHLYQSNGFCEARADHSVSFDHAYDEADLTFKITEGRHHRVKDWLVDAQGESVPAELAQVVKVKSGEFYDESLARKDTLAIGECYRKLGKNVMVTVDLACLDNGFLQVCYRVALPPHVTRKMNPVSSDGVIVHVCLDKAPRQIQEVVYRNVKYISEESLHNLTKIDKGMPLDPVANLLACKEIQDHLKNKGRYWAKVTLDEGNRISDQRVVFNIDEGPLVKIHATSFAGNKTFTSETLLKQLDSSRTCQGCFGIFSEAALRSDVKKLEAFYKAHGYRDVKVCRQLSFGKDRAQVDVVFHIEEGARVIGGQGQGQGGTGSNTVVVIVPNLTRNSGRGGIGASGGGIGSTR